MLKDKFGRKLTSMRISITQRCNIYCPYCHREGEEKSEYEMTPTEIQNITKIGVKYGVMSVKLTGGEPLLRKDICKIISWIKKTGVNDISLTTNGILLKNYAKELKRAGLNRVNVSYNFLNGEYIKNGVREALSVGLFPVKINTVIMKGVNEKLVSKFISFSKRMGTSLQLIELMDVGKNHFYKHFHYDLKKIEKELEKSASKVINLHFQARKRYIIDGVEVDVVRPMHNSLFCAHCTRIRVTSDGKLKPCLFRNDNLIDIIGPMRKGASFLKLEKLFVRAVKNREPYFKNLKF